jgi:hypothetical protein
MMPNRFPLLIAAILLLEGCANLGVEPWERDLLAKPEMQLISDPIEVGLDDHIYFSKEASTGGAGTGGGGCGCN